MTEFKTEPLADASTHDLQMLLLKLQSKTTADTGKMAVMFFIAAPFVHLAAATEDCSYQADSAEPTQNSINSRLVQRTIAQRRPILNFHCAQMQPGRGLLQNRRHILQTARVAIFQIAAAIFVLANGTISSHKTKFQSNLSGFLLQNSGGYARLMLKNLKELGFSVQAPGRS